jgi:hypothetical protein
MWRNNAKCIYFWQLSGYNLYNLVPTVSVHLYSHLKQVLKEVCKKLPGGLLKRASTEFNMFCSSTYEYGYVKAKKVVARMFSRVRYLKLKMNTSSSTYKLWKHQNIFIFIRIITITTCVRYFLTFYFYMHPFKPNNFYTLVLEGCQQCYRREIRQMLTSLINLFFPKSLW